MRISTRQLLAITVLVLIGAGFSAFGGSQETADPSARPRDTDVAQTPEQNDGQTLVERGVVVGATAIPLQCDVPREATILEVVPDGTIVKKGDLLLSFDDSALQQELSKQKIAIAKVEARLASANSRLELLIKTNKDEIALAELRLKAAVLARDREIDDDGEIALEIAKANQQIELSQRILKAAKAKLASRENESGDDVRDALELAVLRAQTHVDAAMAEKQLLTEHVKPHRTAVLELGVQQAKAELLQTERRLEHEKQAADAERRALAVLLENEGSRLNRLEEQISHCKIMAPSDGVVLHARPPGRGANSPSLAPGAIVREQQNVLTLVDPDDLRVRVHVREAFLDRLREGQDVILRIDALPGQSFAGKIDQIGRKPEPSRQSATRDPKEDEYAVLVAFKEQPQRLRIGLTAEVEIRLAAEDER